MKAETSPPRSASLFQLSSFSFSAFQFALLFFAACVARADLPELWPQAVKAPQPAELSQRCAALDAPAPPELKPALRFEQVFLKILASRDSKAQPLEAGWVAEARVLIAADRADNPVAHGVAEVARTWLARVNMLKLQGELTQYYRHHVQFPAQLAEIEASLPEGLRRDPWGQPWVYKCEAPKGMAKLSDQRYRLGPSLYPNLNSLRESVGDRNPAPPQWKLSLQRLGDKPALEIRGANSSLATLQPGGKIDDYTLLYMSDNWALFASPDQLFALRF